MPFYTDFPVYPTEILNLTDYPQQVDNINDVLAALVNALRDEMIAVQTELGTVPKGAYADVKTRLDYYTAWQNYTQSAGRVSGGAVTDGGGGTADIAAGSGYFKTTDSETGATVLLSWSLVSGLALVDNAVNYIHVNYNAGTPVVQTTTDRTTIELNREFTLARIFRAGTTLHIINSGISLPIFLRKEHERLLSVRGFERATGGEISETGTRNIASTAGRFYLGLNHVDTAAKDTAVADTFSSWYRAGAGGWTEVTAQTQIDNGYYDDGTGTLHALTANRYAVFWVYIHFDSDLHVIYGQGDYKLTDAENAVLPDSLPDQVQDFGTLAAKIIIKKNAAAFTSIVSAYKTLFPVSSPPDHNDLGGLQGGQAAQYYHLNNTQHGVIPASGIHKKIQDADADTGFNTEETADKDEIQGKVAGVEFFRGHSSGIITTPKQSAISVYRSTAWTAAHNTWGTIVFNAESYDVHNEADSVGKYTVTQPGKYRVTVVTAGIDTRTYMIGIGIAKNLSVVAQVWDYKDSADPYCGNPCSKTFDLAIADYIHGVVYQYNFTNGQAISMDYGSKATYMTIEKVS